MFLLRALLVAPLKMLLLSEGIPGMFMLGLEVVMVSLQHMKFCAQIFERVASYMRPPLKKMLKRTLLCKILRG